MARIPSSIIDDIMNTARIEEVVGDYVQLKKSGANYKALSPFTEENTPSFMVSPAKQIFKCFSSGKGGTVVTFLMEVEQFSYPEALKWLAQKYNIEIPEDKPLTPEEEQEISEKESLRIINGFARDFFAATLKNSNEGRTIGYSYFKERGFEEGIIDKFQLGYCPREEKSFTDTAIEKGYKQKYLEELGLTKGKDNRKFDFFSGRVIFPIHSISGKVLGFGGRTLKTGKKIAKYFNSPESVLYDKSRILYGIYFAKNEIVKQDNCYLVEGYTDVISLFQSGIENVVASSGTSLTTGQINLVQRYTSNITVLYDGDAAGIKASFRGIDLLLEAGMNIKVLTFPDGDDPDSYAKKVGADHLKSYLKENKQDFVDFKANILLQSAGDDPIQRSKLIKEIINSVALIPDSITRSVYAKEIALRFEIEEQTLMNELNKIRRKNFKNKNSISQQTTEQPAYETPFLPKKGGKEVLKRDFYFQEYDLIRILVLYGSRAVEIINREAKKEEEEEIEVSVAELIIYEIERDELTFENEIFQTIYTLCREGLENNIFYEPQRFLRHEDRKIVHFVTDILSDKHELSSQWFNKYKIETVMEIHSLPRAVKEALYMFKNSIILKRMEKIQEALKKCQSNEDKTRELLQNQTKLIKVRGALSQQLNRIVM